MPTAPPVAQACARSPFFATPFFVVHRVGDEAVEILRLIDGRSAAVLLDD